MPATFSRCSAIDIVYLGSKLIIVEFGGGVLMCVALGTFVLFRGHSFWQIALGPARLRIAAMIDAPFQPTIFIGCVRHNYGGAFTAWWLLSNRLFKLLGRVYL